MVTITASQVQELRKQSGAGLPDCLQALNACDGDVQKAYAYLHNIATGRTYFKKREGNRQHGKRDN